MGAGFSLSKKSGLCRPFPHFLSPAGGFIRFARQGRGFEICLRSLDEFRHRRNIMQLRTFCALEYTSPAGRISLAVSFICHALAGRRRIHITVSRMVWNRSRGL